VFNSGALTLTNSTVLGNGTGFGGGGVSNSGTLTLTNSTVSGNASGFGSGGVDNSDTLTLTRTLISGNTTARGPSPEVSNGDSSTIIANDFNLFGHDGNAGVSGFSPGPNDIIPAVPLNKILAPLANNSGPTLTHALLRGSPAVDAVESGCPPPSTDQRGVGRPQDGDGDSLALCDIGAFELKPTGEPPSCAAVKPTQGCTVNGVPNQLCWGTSGNDTILGTQGSDVILGLSGKDVLLGRDGNDQLCGGEGNDVIKGGVGDDLIQGRAGNDRLEGEQGADRILGGVGNDVLRGGSGDDFLDGGKNSDQLDGQQDIDTCVNGERVNGCEETGS
jgi:Ca2+-binding RTX toxin-like protein